MRRLDLDGVMLLDFQQQLDGVPVFEGHAKVLLGADGHITAAALPERFPRETEPATTRLSADDALRIAFRAAGAQAPVEFTPATAEAAGRAFANPLGQGKSAILADLVMFPLTDEVARLAWRVSLELDGLNWYEIIVDASDGRLLFRHSLYRQAGTGKVWKVAPSKGERETIPFPDSWLASGATVTTGNNADAYLDANGDDRPDTLPDAGIRNGRAYSETSNFDFPAPDLALPRDPRLYRAAAVTNAFYLVNVAHDYFYGLGFNEEAGAFQRDNGGKGGKSGDPVLVEVQDLYHSDNASMTLTSDGVSPRLQIGVYTSGTAKLTDDRDLAYDGQTVIHEYAHGVANRLVGAGRSTSCLAGTQSRALDEGWADYFAASFFNDPVQSGWVSPNPSRGLRRQSYENYTLTYEDFANEGDDSHRDGELWAAALWDLRKTLGQQMTDRLVFRALMLTPCRPSFIDARDAILAADQALNSGANRAKIFTVFARHGMGASASGYDDSPETMTVFNVAFDLPADIAGGTTNLTPVISSRPAGFAVAGEAFVYQIEASDRDGGTIGYELSQGPAGMTLDARTGLVKWVPGFMPERAKIVVTDNQGGRVIHGLYIRVLTPLTAGRPLTVSMPRGRGGTASILVPGGSTVLQAMLRGESGDANLALMDPSGFPYIESPRSGSYETISVASPAAGRWFVVVAASTAVENVQLTVRLPEPRLLAGNGKLEALNAEKTSETYYRVIVPPATNDLQVTTEGVSGDVDLVMRRARVPVCQVFDFAISYRCEFDVPYGNFRYSNSESLRVPSPQPGDWYINLTTTSGYSGVTLTTRMDVRPTLVTSASSLTFNALEGGAAPPAQSIRITDPSGSSFTWNAAISAGANWLRIDKTSGTGDSSFAASVNLQGLAPGVHNATITITTSGLSGSPQTIRVTLNLTRLPVISANAAQLNFTSATGQNPPVQRLQFENTGGGTLEWTVAAATTSGGAWLSVDQPRGTGNTNLQVIVQAGSLPPGVYDGTITIAANDAASVVVRVRYTVVVPVLVLGDGLRSAASMKGGRAVSPGEVLLLQGSNLTQECSTGSGAPNPCPKAEGYPLPVELGGTRVTVNGTPAPLLAASPTEIRFIVPFELEGTEARIVVTRQGVSAAPLVRELAAQSLGIFSMLENGAGAARLYHSDGTPVTRVAPLKPEETVDLLAGGLGAVAPTCASGTAAPSAPLSQAAGAVKVLFDGQEATPSAAYLEPGMAGIYRIQMAVPAALARKYPALVLQSAVSVSNETSAGGPSLLDVTPGLISRGGDAVVTLRGLNLPEGAGVKIGEEVLTGELSDGALQSLRITIPARLLESAAELQLAVFDPAAPQEAPSNIVVLKTQ